MNNIVYILILKEPTSFLIQIISSLGLNCGPSDPDADDNQGATVFPLPLVTVD